MVHSVSLDNLKKEAKPETSDISVNRPGHNTASIKKFSMPEQEKLPNTKIDDWAPLLKKIAENKDRVAYRKVFDHFAPKIKTFILSLSSQHTSPELAEEIVQEVMLKVWLKAASFNSDKANSNTWIYTIARNTRIDFLRKLNRIDTNLTADDLWPLEDEEDPFISLEQHRVTKTIHESLAQLPQEQAQVIKEIYIEGKSHSDVANSNQLPLGTVKSRVRLAINKLKTNLFNDSNAELID